VVVMKSTIFWDIMPYSLLNVRSGTRLATCFHAGIMLGLFHPEDGDGLKRWLTLSVDYVVLYSR
jgi:hypothetical protein